MTKFSIVLLSWIAISWSNISWSQSQTRHKEKLVLDTSVLLPVNGVMQYLEIKGSTKTKPVLLFIHGGPSWSATPMNRKYNQSLSKDFIFVSWDQRIVESPKPTPLPR
jgi:hypothetical protein